MVGIIHFKTCLFIIGLFILPGSEAGALSALKGVNETQASAYASFVKQMNSSSWNSVKAADLNSLNPSQLQQLLNAGQATMPQRIKTEITRLTLPNMSNEGIRNSLGDSQVSPGVLQQVQKALPPPELLTPVNITFLGKNVLKLGNGYLLRITNITTLQAVYQLAYQAYSSSHDPSVSEKYKSLLNHLILKINGPPETWTTSMIRSMDLTTITANMAARLPPSVVVSVQDSFTLILGGSANIQLRRIILKKILAGNNFYNVQSEPTQALKIINGLGNWRNNLLPEDITDNILLQNQEISYILTQNVQNVAKTGNLSPKSAFLLLKSLQNIDNITSAGLSVLGTNVIGFAPPNMIRKAGQTRAFLSSDVPQIVNGLQNGVGKAAKLQALADIVSSSLDANNPRVSQYPNEIISNLPPTIITKVSEGDAAVILSRDGDEAMDEYTMRNLLNKVNSGYASLTEKARSLLSNTKVRGMQLSETLKVAAGLPPVSSVAMVAAEMAFSSKSKIDVLAMTQSPTAVPFMGAKEAIMVDVADIMDVLLQMKDVNPSMAACCILKNKYYNYTRDFWGSNSEDDTVKQMSVTDIESMPVCVFACFGANVINYLSNDAKVSLLTRLGLVENPNLSIPRPFTMKAIKNGLSAMRSGTGIFPGDVEVIGNALNDVPGNLLSSASAEVVPDVIAKLNTLIMKRQMLPCLNSEQRDAVGSLVKKFKGGPSTWDDMDDVVCLLSYLPVDDLNKIPNSVMASSTCQLGGVIPILNETLMVLCGLSLGMTDLKAMMIAQAQLKDIQIQAALNMVAATSFPRKKRQTASDPSSICAKAGYAGANGFTDAELSSFSYSTIMTCLSDFGSIDMAQSKAKILAETLKNGAYLTSFNESFLRNMGFIIKGLPSTDFSKLATFTYETSYDNVVAFLGSISDLSMDQIQQIAMKVKMEWRSPRSMSSLDIRTVNRLLCGFTSTDISSMSPDAVRGAMGTISQLDECHLNPVINAFASVVKIIYSGNITSWTKADIMELGVIINGLTPEDIIKIDPPSLEGLTPSAMATMPLDSIKTLGAEHFLYLNPATAQSVTAQQQSVMTPGAQRALEASVAGFIYVDSSAVTHCIGSLNVILFLSAVFFYGFNVV